MFSAAKLHVMYAVANAQVRQFPFQHVCIPDIFPPNLYGEIQRHRVPDRGFKRLSETGRVGRGAYKERLVLFDHEVAAADMDITSREFWSGMFKMLLDRELTQTWLNLFEATIRQHFADDIPEIAKNGGAKIFAEAMLMRDLPMYALGPHTDAPSKVVSVLFYLPPDGNRPELGTSLYLPRDRGFTCEGRAHHPFDKFERLATMPFLPNTAVAFPKTRRSFHGVEPVLDPEARRDLLIYDLRVDAGRG